MFFQPRNNILVAVGVDGPGGKNHQFKTFCQFRNGSYHTLNRFTEFATAGFASENTIEVHGNNVEAGSWSFIINSTPKVGADF